MKHIILTAQDETEFRINPMHLISWWPANVQVKDGPQVRGSKIVITGAAGAKDVLDAAGTIDDRFAAATGSRTTDEG